MAVTDTVANGIADSGNMISRAWDASKGKIAVIALSAVLAGATGGASLTAQAAVEAGGDIAVTGTDMVLTAAKSTAHNLSGAADLIGTASEWFMEPDGP